MAHELYIGLHLCNLRGQAEEAPQHKVNENRTAAKSGRSDFHYQRESFAMYSVHHTADITGTIKPNLTTSSYVIHSYSSIPEAKISAVRFLAVCCG